MRKVVELESCRSLLVLVLVLPCGLFGGGLADAQVIFRLGDIAAAPGEADVIVPIELDVAPGQPAVQRVELMVGYDPSALGNVRIESTRVADRVLYYDQNEFVEPGIVGAMIYWRYYEASEAETISSQNDGVIATLRFCVLESAPPGLHALHFVEYADRWQYGDQSLLYRAGGSLGFPDTQGGSVTVAGAVVPGDACPPDEHDTSPPTPPSGLQATFRLRGGSAARGETVEVPFSINTDGEATGFSFSIDFDEEALEALEVDKRFENPDGTNWSFSVLDFNNENETPGNHGVDEGFVLGAAVFSTAQHVVLPAGVDNEVLRLRFRVHADAPVGSTEVIFADGARSSAEMPGVSNTVIVDGRALEPDVDISVILIKAVFKIVGEISMFIRGDANGDTEVDMTDAQVTLSTLYLGESLLLCDDAADSNDDGEIDLSDPIFTLSFLFLGGPPLPPPTDSPGDDPTWDVLGCQRGQW